MKILITSDTHRREEKLNEIMEKHHDCEYHLDAGDSQLSTTYLDNHQIISVKGNTDFFIDLPHQRIIDIGDLKILLIHGHRHWVKFGLKQLEAYARSLNVNLCIYGHTHTQQLTELEGLTLINPGAVKDGFYAIYNNGKIKLYKE